MAHALLLYFAARLLFLAWSIDPSVPPDEYTHLGLARAWAEARFLPTDTPETIALGGIAGQPPLYYALLGALLLAIPLPVSDLLLLRLLNVAMALCTAWYAGRFARQLSGDSRVELIALVMATHTLMFTGIGAAVSYDNLTNLLAAASAFHWLRLLQRPTSVDLAALSALTLAGCLTKVTFLPLAALYGVTLFARAAWLARSADAPYFDPTSWRRPGVRTLGIAVLLGVLLASNLALYGGNWLHYGSLRPGLDQVVGREAALSNRTFLRGEILRLHRDGRVPLRSALAMADRIDHAADRQSTRGLLVLAHRAGDQRMGPARYALVWTHLMLERTFGYFGHRVLARSTPALAVYAVCFALAIGFFAGRSRGRTGVAPTAFCLFVAAGYALILMWVVNWVTYLETGLPDLAVQGRYLFPVLAPAVGFTATSLGILCPARARLPLLIAMLAWFGWGDLPYFLLHAGPEWFAVGF